MFTGESVHYPYDIKLPPYKRDMSKVDWKSIKPQLPGEGVFQLKLSVRFA